MNSLGKRRGYVTVLAMMMLVIGTTLCAWLFTVVQTGTSATRNEEASAKARMVTESGLELMRFRLGKACEASPIAVTEDTRTMLVELGEAVQPLFPAGQVLIREDSAAVPYVEVLSTAVNGGTFVSTLKLSDVASYASPGVRLSVTGTAGKATCTIGTEYLLNSDNSDAWQDYPMLSHGDMTVDGNAKVHHWNIAGNKADQDVLGKVYNVGDDNVMTFDGAPPTHVKFPSKYLPDRVYGKLDEIKNTAALPTYRPPTGGGGKGGKGKPGGTTQIATLGDCYVPPNTPLTLSAGAVITGVVYVGYPNSITISNDVTINGIIVYEKPDGPEATSVITFDRVINVRSSPTLTKDAMASLMLRSGESAESAAAYGADVAPWTIHAPDTDLDLVEGNTGDVNYWGSFHIKDFLKAAGAGGGSPDRYVIHGSIVCEGEVTMTGNRSFAVSPESEARPQDEPDWLALDVRPGGYWER